MVIDFSYLFWGGQLKYIFPPDYLTPISDLYLIIIEKVIMIFKLDKLKPNIIDEAKEKRTSGPYIKENYNMNNGGINNIRIYN